jgi:hypothetical protein
MGSLRHVHDPMSRSSAMISFERRMKYSVSSMRSRPRFRIPPSAAASLTSAERSRNNPPPATSCTDVPQGAGVQGESGLTGGRQSERAGYRRTVARGAGAPHRSHRNATARPRPGESLVTVLRDRSEDMRVIGGLETLREVRELVIDRLAAVTHSEGPTSSVSRYH